MAITSAMRQDIMELAVLMNNKAPGTALLGELIVAANSGQTLEQIAGTLAARADFKATYPLHQTAEEFGAEWIGNILPEADATLQAECVKIVEAHINGGGSVAALVVSVQSFMSDSANAAGDLKVHIDNFSNKVAVATYHTITQETATEWAIPSTVTSDAASVTTGKSSVDTAVTAATATASKTLSLTTGVDSLNGDSGDDTFNGVVQGAGVTGSTASPGDVVNGGAGTDTFNLSVAGNGGGAHTVQAVQTNDVENLLVTNFDLNALDTTIDTSLMTGLSKIGLYSSNATGGTVFSGMQSIVDAQMSNGAGNLTLTYAGGTTGTTDVQNLAISATTAGTFTANGLETVAVTGSLAANKLANIAGTGLTKITIGGDQNFTMSGASAIKTIDAGANTGKTSLVLAANAAHVVTLGSGDDTLDVGTTMGAGDKIQGGAGTDTIKINAAGTINGGATATDVTAEFLQSGGFEVIDIASTNDLATLALKNIPGVETVKAASNQLTVVLDANAGDTAKVTNSTAITGTLNGNAITTAATDGSATSGEAAVLLKTQIDAITGFSAEVTAATIVITNTTSAERIDFALTAAHTAPDSAVYSDLTVSGITTQAVDVYTADKVTARMLDPSGTSDAISVNLKTVTADKNAAQTVTEIDVADTIETINLNASGMKTGTSAVQKTLTTLTADASTTALNISGTDKLTIGTITAGSLVTIDAGTYTGDLQLTSSTAKAQTITTGSGNDTINMGATLGATDVIDGGGNTALASTAMGKDKVTATGNQGSTVTAAALQLSNVETLEIATGGAAATYIDGTNLSGLGTIAVSSTSGTVTLSAMPAGVGIGLGIADGESASTYTYTLADATGTEDALTLSYPAGVDASTSNTIAVSDVETLNVVASSEAANAEVSTLVLTNAKVSTINVTKGHANDTLALGTLNKTVTTLDAGAAKNIITATGGAVGMTVTVPATVANTVTTSTKADTFTVKGNLGTVIQVLNGGASASASANDTINVTLNNAASDFTSISGFETVNATILAATATGFDDATKNDGIEAAGTINILGGNANSSFTVDATAKFDTSKTITTPQTLDASTFGGSLDVHYGTDDLDAYTTVKGGSSTSDKVTTTITAAAAATENKPTMSGVERLVINTVDADTDAVINLANVTGLTRIDATFTTNTNDDQIEIDGAPQGVAYVVTATNATDNLQIDLASSSGASDAIAITSAANNAGLNLDAAGVESLTITNSVTSSYDLAGVSPTTGSTGTVTISGAGNATLTALHTGINTIDAAALAGTLSVAAAARDTDAYTITGGVNNDTIAMENAGDVLTGGSQAVSGADTLIVSYTGILGGITADLSAADQIVSMDGGTNSAVQGGFENLDVRDYVNFGAVITGSDGANTITGTPLADRITAGKGNDIIQLPVTDDADTDVMDGGAGTDTFAILAGDFTPGADSTIANVETITSGVASVINLSTQTEGFTVTTTAGIQTITGGAGNDIISAGDAADIITLGATGGVDSLTLGAGGDANKIITSSVTDGNYFNVTDFAVAADLLDFNGAVKSDNGSVTAVQGAEGAAIADIASINTAKTSVAITEAMSANAIDDFLAGTTTLAAFKDIALEAMDDDSTPATSGATAGLDTALDDPSLVLVFTIDDEDTAVWYVNNTTAGGANVLLASEISLVGIIQGDLVNNTEMATILI